MSHIDSRQYAYEMNERGACHFRAGRYVEAGRDYRTAARAVGKEDPNRLTYLFNCANSLQLMWRFDEAESLYRQILESDNPSELGQSVESEIGKLSVTRQQKGLYATDKRLFEITAWLIPLYPRMNRRITIAWVNESRESMAWITRIQDEHGTPKDNRVTSLSGWEAIGHIIGEGHWIFVKTRRWVPASDKELSGLVSHEMVHEEMKDTLPPEFFLEGKAAENLVHDERLTDRIAIYKGLGEELMASRQLMESGGASHHSGVMSPKDIRRVLISKEETLKKAEFQSWLARSLAEKLGDDNLLVREEFRGAIPLWELVVKHRTSPAHARDELEIAIRHSNGVS